MPRRSGLFSRNRSSEARRRRGIFAAEGIIPLTLDPSVATNGDRGILAALVIVSGAILDVQARMNPIACAVDDCFGENPAESATNRGRIPAIGDKNFPRHILVVDDEPLIRWSITESLSGLGMDVEQAADALSALRLVTNTTLPFHVVVLDLRLPDMADLSLLGTLRQLLPQARMILMTAFGTTDITTHAAFLGATVLTKPFELDDLTRLVLAADRRPS